MTSVRNLANRLIRKLRSAPPPRSPRPYEEQFSPSMDLPLYEGRPRLYLIASTPRSGSHFLGHALSEMRFFGVPLEYLNKANLHAWQERFGVGDAGALLGEIARRRSGETGWFGVKAHWSQFAPHETDERLHALGGFQRAIWIYRRDLLAQAMSFLTAEQTGQWISGAPKTGEARFGYAAIVSKAATVRAQNTAWRSFFADRFEQPVHRVVYEDLIEAPDHVLAGVADFLDPSAGVRPTASARTRKQSGHTGEEWRRRFHESLRDEDRWILEPQAW